MATREKKEAERARVRVRDRATVRVC